MKLLWLELREAWLCKCLILYSVWHWGLKEICAKSSFVNQICVFLQNCGAPPPLRGPGPLTVFVPTNQAVDRARDGSILYMLNDVRPQGVTSYDTFHLFMISADNTCWVFLIINKSNKKTKDFVTLSQT